MRAQGFRIWRRFDGAKFGSKFSFYAGVGGDMVNCVFHAACCTSCSCCYVANGFLFKDEWRTIFSGEIGSEYAAQQIGLGFILRATFGDLLYLYFGVLDSIQP